MRHKEYEMYLVTKDGRERFLGFLRNLGSQAILFTAFSIVLVTLDSAVDADQRYILATVMIFYSDCSSFGCNYKYY